MEHLMEGPMFLMMFLSGILSDVAKRKDYDEVMLKIYEYKGQIKYVQQTEETKQ